MILLTPHQLMAIKKRFTTIDGFSAEYASIKNKSINLSQNGASVEVEIYKNETAKKEKGFKPARVEKCLQFNIPAEAFDIPMEENETTQNHLLRSAYINLMTLPIFSGSEAC